MFSFLVYYYKWSPPSFSLVVFVPPDNLFSKILICEIGSGTLTDSWTTVQLSHTGSDVLGRIAWVPVPCCWWSLWRWSVWHTRPVCSCERNLLRSSPLQLAPRSRSPSGRQGVLLNLPAQTIQKAHRTAQLSAAGGLEVLSTANNMSSFPCRFFCSSVQVCSCECAQTADSTVPGRSLCRPPGILHRSCHSGCPPERSGPASTSPDMNFERWWAPALLAAFPLLAEALNMVPQTQKCICYLWILNSSVFHIFCIFVKNVLHHEIICSGLLNVD